MAVICDHRIKVQGFDVTIPNAYHRIDRVKGGKIGAIAIVAVQEVKGGPIKTTWSFGFTPDTSDRNWIAQAYDAMLLLPQMANARSDDPSDPYFEKPARESFMERRARFRLEHPDVVLPPVEGEAWGPPPVDSAPLSLPDPDPVTAAEPVVEPDPAPQEQDEAPEPAPEVESPASVRGDVELSEIDDVELARAIVLQRLSAEAARRAGMTMDAYIRVARLAEIIADPDSTDEERRDAELEAAQFKERAEAGAPYELARQLKAAKVATLVTIEQLRAYDIYEGWPA